MPGTPPDYISTPDTIVGNAYYGGSSANWRYAANGMAFMLTMTPATGVSVLVAVSGSIDAIITWIEIADFLNTSNIHFSGPLRIDASSDGDLIIINSPHGNLELTTPASGGNPVVIGSTGNDVQIGVSAIFGAGSPSTHFLGNIGVLVGAGADALTVHGDALVDSAIKLPALTASRPLKLDSGHNTVAAQIDLGSSNDVTASGLSAGSLMKWDGAEVVGAGGIATGNVTEIISGPTGGIFLTNAVLSGTVPPGLTLTLSTATALTGFGVATHAVTDGLITS